MTHPLNQQLDTVIARRLVRDLMAHIDFKGLQPGTEWNALHVLYGQLTGVMGQLAYIDAARSESAQVAS